MKIYIDFDGTLFNTDKYTNDFMHIFNEYGIDNNIFDEVKKELFNNENLFNLDSIMDYLIDKYNIDIGIKEKIYKLLDTSYVYPEVKDCLNTLISYGYDLCMLTYGDNSFQNMKINSSNISKYFNEIIITDKDKSELNIDYRNSIFIDNNPLEIEKFCGSKAKIVIRIRRDNDRYSKYECNRVNVIECKDFNEVVKYLKGGFKNE